MKHAQKVDALCALVRATTKLRVVVDEVIPFNSDRGRSIERELALGALNDLHDIHAMVYREVIDAKANR